MDAREVRRHCLSALDEREHDVLVIGGGIHGACVAWDAALRGLKVAIVDEGDFGHATSANSLKTIHGGLRYLQDLNLRLVREMIQERAAYMRIAPHLVKPLRCVMPTYGFVKSTRSVLLLSAGLLLNDLLGFDRNVDLPAWHRLPRGRIASRDECLRLIPGLRDDGVTGAAIWYDAQAVNTERLTLAFVLGAMAAGATACNYMQAARFIGRGSRVAGVECRDTLEGTRVYVRAKVVVNAAGPWIDRVIEMARGSRPEPMFGLSRAMNLVIPQLVSDHAVAVPSRDRFDNGKAVRTRERLLFLVPWRDQTIVGTTHLPSQPGVVARNPTAADVQDFIDELNLAYPPARLTLDDVRLVHTGFLPAEPIHGRSVKLVRRSVVVDHRARDGLENLVTIVGVKYTGARAAAQRAVDMTCDKLGLARRCTTAHTPVFGGAIESIEALSRKAEADSAGVVDARSVRRIVRNYGTQCFRVLRLGRADPRLAGDVVPGADASTAEIVHAIREEMAMKLSDVVFRRTDLGSAGQPSCAALVACATVMGDELGWSAARTQTEIDEVRSAGWVGHFG
jgi:glycerol-3-phosphate dehydrogenase